MRAEEDLVSTCLLICISSTRLGILRRLRSNCWRLRGRMPYDAMLLDMNPDRRLTGRLREAIDGMGAGTRS